MLVTLSLPQGAAVGARHSGFEQTSPARWRMTVIVDWRKSSRFFLANVAIHPYLNEADYTG